MSRLTYTAEKVFVQLKSFREYTVGLELREQDCPLLRMQLAEYTTMLEAQRRLVLKLEAELRSET